MDLILVSRITPPASGSKLFLPNNRLLTEIEVQTLASAYWPGNEISNASRIAKCESGWWTGAWAWEGEDSRGLWQINVEPAAHPDLLFYDLGDPQINAYWAHQIWLTSGWYPWSCAKILGIV